MPVVSNYKSVRLLFVGIILLTMVSVSGVLASETEYEQAASSQARISFLPQRSEPETDSSADFPKTNSQQLLNVAKAFDSSAQFMAASKSDSTVQRERNIRQASFNESAADPAETGLAANRSSVQEKAPALELPPKQVDHATQQTASSATKPIEAANVESSGNIGQKELETNEPPVAEPQPIDDESESNADSLLDTALVFSKSGSKKNGRLERPRLTGAVAPIISVVGSLLIVLATFLFLAILFKKFSPKSGRVLPKEAFEDLGRAFLGQKTNLHLLRLGNRLILVCVTPDGVSPVTEVTDPDEVVPLLGMCRQLDENSSSELFKQTLSKIIDKESGDDDYFGTKIQQKTSTRQRAAQKDETGNGSSLDLYSDSNESLTDLLASGLPTKGARHG